MNLFIARKSCGECVFDKSVAVDMLDDNPKLEELTSSKRFMSKIKFTSHRHPTKIEYKLHLNVGRL